jgi:anti-sigma factor RsiW
MVSHPAGESLSGLVDAELDGNTRREIERHLRDCAICMGVVADLRRVVDEIGALEDRAPATSLWPEIAAEIGKDGF